MHAFGGNISSRGFLWGIEIPQSDVFAVHADLSVEPAIFGGDSEQTDFVAGACFPDVLNVFGSSRRPKVYPSIVVSDAVDMVNVSRRGFAEHEYECEAVSFEKLTAEVNGYVTTGLEASRRFVHSPSSSGFHPKKEAGFLFIPKDRLKLGLVDVVRFH